MLIWNVGEETPISLFESKAPQCGRWVIKANQSARMLIGDNKNVRVLSEENNREDDSSLTSHEPN